MFTKRWADKRMDSKLRNHEGLLHATTWMNLKNIMLCGEARCKRSHAVWLHLYEISTIGKLVEIDCRLEVAMDERKKGARSICLTGIGFCVLMMEMFWDLIELVAQHREYSQCHWMMHCKTAFYVMLVSPQNGIKCSRRHSAVMSFVRLWYFNFKYFKNNFQYVYFKCTWKFTIWKSHHCWSSKKWKFHMSMIIMTATFWLPCVCQITFRVLVLISSIVQRGVDVLSKF